MKFLLASKAKFLLEKGYNVLGIPRDQMRIGAISTALNRVADQDFLQYMEEYRADIKSSGISFEEFDLEGKSKNEILDFFKDKNIIEVFGGNVFYLLKICRETGFEEILKSFFNEGKIYIGCSAGSYIMCPTIEVAGWKKGRDTYGVIDPTSFGYVSYLLKCHYTDEQKEKVTEKLKDLKYPLRLLKDDQAILIEDGKETFIGEEKEIILK